MRNGELSDKRLAAVADELLRDAPQEPAPVGQVGYCDTCRHYAAEWHAGCHGAVRPAEGDPSIGYYAQLDAFAELTKGRKARVDLPAEWREPPGYPGYLLHSVTRELRRPARDVTLPSGRIRCYPERVQLPKNGSFSLTVAGNTSSRGVNALWLETFPEAGRKKRKKKAGEWDDTIVPKWNELNNRDGLSEWLATGAAGIEKRPK